MTDNFNIENNKSNKTNDKNKVELSNKQRKEFKDTFNQQMEEFDLINSLIEEHLDETKPEKTERNLPETEKGSLEIKQSFNDPAKITRERLQRIGLLKSDPTGKNIKASGEDV